MPAFLQPLWLRLILAVIAGGWAVFEFTDGSTIWGVLFAAFAAYTVFGVWVDFSSGPPKPALPPPQRDGGRSGEEDPARQGEDRDQDKA
ncbi:MAG: DUF3329 domain-containing protein [Rhizobiaceae bacterium]